MLSVAFSTHAKPNVLCSSGFSLVAEAVKHLKVRSCLIDGEVVCCDERGVAAFHVLRHRRNEPQAFLYAFDLLELNGTDMRREPIEVRKAATLTSILRKAKPAMACGSTNIWSTPRASWCFSTPAKRGPRKRWRCCAARSPSRRPRKN